MSSLLENTLRLIIIVLVIALVLGRLFHIFESQAHFFLKLRPVFFFFSRRYFALILLGAREVREESLFALAYVVSQIPSRIVDRAQRKLIIQAFFALLLLSSPYIIGRIAISMNLIVIVLKGVLGGIILIVGKPLIILAVKVMNIVYN